MELGLVEGRILGSLIEKQLNTPHQYPLSLNSLVLACNQASNRDPVVSYTEAQVQEGLDALKGQGLLRFVLPSHGRSVVRYRHVLDEKLALDARQMALVAVLLLRGPQTPGELRIRTERMAPFDGTGAVESDLEGLSRREDPLVARLARRAGQKEERWTQLLTVPSGAPLPPEPGTDATAPSTTGPDEDLRGVVAALREEVASLRAEVADLRRAWGG